MRIFIIIIIILATFWNSSTAQEGTLKVKVTNIEKASGTMQIGLYNLASQFPQKGKEYKKVRVRVSDKETTYTFKNLPKGEYAVALYHDSNSDGECNTNWVGVPTEGYGFSNNVMPLLSAPSFWRTKFSVADFKAISIALR
ncbi:MAG: DUF2141 domain-containing protein [Aureispira sp.]|nr:DUF2141 domain-containing protein [Aureispira sp.]